MRAGMQQKKKHFQRQLQVVSKKGEAIFGYAPLRLQLKKKQMYSNEINRP